MCPPPEAAERLDRDALPELAALLEAAGLPAQDLAERGRRFWRLRDAAGILGYGGLEGDGPDLLLRSVVVVPARRGGGVGRVLVAALVAEARHLGAERLWLLTTGAAGFFDRLGFRPAARDAVPPAIAATAQFVGLCPASADCRVLAVPPIAACPE